MKKRLLTVFLAIMALCIVMAACEPGDTRETAPEPDIDRIVATTTSISLESDFDQENYFLEFSIDGGATWQGSGLFDGLTPNTEYTFLVRAKDNNYFKGSAAVTVKASTKGLENSELPPQGSVKFTYINGVVTVTSKPENVEISFDGTNYSDSALTHTYNRTSYGEKKFYARYKSTGQYAASGNTELSFNLTRYATGDGTAADPYVVDTAAQFLSITEYAYFKLAADINLQGNIISENLASIYGIDGDGHTISNVTVQSESGSYNAIFLEIVAYARNLKIRNANVTVNSLIGSAESFTAILAARGKAEYTDCDIEGTITVSTGDGFTYQPSMPYVCIGGIVGSAKLQCDRAETITRCRADVGITYTQKAEFSDNISYLYIGGIAGNFATSETGSVDFSECLSEGSIVVELKGSGDIYGSYVGGITGSAYGSFKNCMSDMQISFDSSTGSGDTDRIYVGGISGEFKKSSKYDSALLPYLEYCLTKGKIELDVLTCSSAYIGGIAGLCAYNFAADTMLIEKCFVGMQINVSIGTNSTSVAMNEIFGYRYSVIKQSNCFGAYTPQYNSEDIKFDVDAEVKALSYLAYADWLRTTLQLDEDIWLLDDSNANDTALKCFL